MLTRSCRRSIRKLTNILRISDQLFLPRHFCINRQFEDANTTTSRLIPPSEEDLDSMEVAQVTKWGAFVNAGLGISKGITGVMIGSTGMIADAANSCGDLLMDAAVYFTVIYSRQGNTPDKPWVSNL